MDLTIRGLRVDVGGEGSRGGIVIGHSNGKPIYASKAKPKHMSPGMSELKYKHAETGRSAAIAKSSSPEGGQRTGTGRRYTTYKVLKATPPSLKNPKGGGAMLPHSTHETFHEAHEELTSGGFEPHIPPYVDRVALRTQIAAEIAERQKQQEAERAAKTTRTTED